MWSSGPRRVWCRRARSLSAAAADWLDGEWWLTIKSVVIFGRIRRIEDPETIERISRALSHKFTQDEEYIDREIDRYAPATLLLALQIEDTQGKIVREK